MPKTVSETIKYNTRSAANGKPMAIVERIWKLSQDMRLVRAQREFHKQAAHDELGRSCIRMGDAKFVCVETGEEFVVESISDRKMMPGEA